MTKVSAAAYAAAGEKLLAHAEGSKNIPYEPGGMSLEGMDCQGLCEYLLIECGVTKEECNLKGSNAHWRSCVWRGTPEECVKAFGCVPPGAWVFIVDHESGGEAARGYADGLGDAVHMGVYLGQGRAIHASASRGFVAESRFEEKTIPNGGWNAVGLPPWVDFGITGEGGADTSGAARDAPEGAYGGEDEGLTIGIMQGDAGASTVRYAVIASPDGNPVKLRKTASQQEPVYWLVNPGARVRVEKTRGDWSLVTAICSDGYRRRAYMMSAFLER